jgi:NADPH-dependent curcumin reductase CurA
MNNKIILKSRPSGKLTSDIFEIIQEEIPTIGESEVLLKTKYLSVDPYMRNRMNAVKSYIEPYELNAPLSGDAIAEVIESNSDNLKIGDLVTAELPWQEFVAIKPDKLRLISTDKEIPVTAYLGALGLTGLTAYFGILDIGKPKQGETVVVSGAAGAVGSIAGQIAKLKGCQVIGIAGKEEKVNYLKNELHFDNAINYKGSKNIRKELKKSCPEGVDIYFDNVGGEISDTVMYLLNEYSRIIMCGQISLYNQNRISMGPRLNAQLIIKRAKMQGFILYDYADQFEEAQQELTMWINEGKLIYHENIVKGFENSVDALLGLFRGDNIGKQIVKIY